MIKNNKYHLFEFLLSFNDELLYKYLCNKSKVLNADISNNYCNTYLSNRKNNNNYYNTRCVNTVNMILNLFDIKIKDYIYKIKYYYKKNMLQNYDNLILPYENLIIVDINYDHVFILLKSSVNIWYMISSWMYMYNTNIYRIDDIYIFLKELSDHINVNDKNIYKYYNNYVNFIQKYLIYKVVIYNKSVFINRNLFSIYRSNHNLDVIFNKNNSNFIQFTSNIIIEYLFKTIYKISYKFYKFDINKLKSYHIDDFDINKQSVMNGGFEKIEFSNNTNSPLSYIYKNYNPEKLYNITHYIETKIEKYNYFIDKSKNDKYYVKFKYINNDYIFVIIPQKIDKQDTYIIIRFSNILYITECNINYIDIYIYINTYIFNNNLYFENININNISNLQIMKLKNEFNLKDIADILNINNQSYNYNDYDVYYPYLDI